MSGIQIPKPFSFFGSLISTGVATTAIFCIGYIFPREDTDSVQLLFLLAFLAYIFQLNILNEKVGFYAGLAIRICLLLSIPSLSTDFYRFIWDGQLIANGLNPFAKTPEDFLNTTTFLEGFTPELYQGLAYKIYYTMYAPITQFTGWIAAEIAGGSILGAVIILRIFVIGADLGVYYFLRKILKQSGKDPWLALLYWLNPLVILELTGNLHHEVYVIVFMLGTAYFFGQKKTITAGVLQGLAIASKLIPLIFLPAYIRRMPVKKLAKLGLVAVGVTLIAYLPFINADLIKANSSSGWLYFQRLEFNGSIYYLVREIGFFVKGYNIIASSGKWMAVLTFVFIMGLSVLLDPKKISLPESFMWILGLYLMFATTLHPWYIIPMIAFAVLTSFRFPLVWSYFIFWTYAGYTNQGYEEPLGWIAVEYVIVYSFLISELVVKKRGGLPFFERYFKGSTIA